MTDSEIVAKIREYLNESRVNEEDTCSCASCLERVAVAVKAEWACEDCGYSGEPVALPFYSWTHGCSHGEIICPVCDTEINTLAVIKEIRRILDSGA